MGLVHYGGRGKVEGGLERGVRFQFFSFRWTRKQSEQ